MSRCEQAEPDSSTSTGYQEFREPPGTPKASKRPRTEERDEKLKSRHRRVKANQRERNRMHGLNDALEQLRGHIPLSYHHQRLSKIETLRLARNYIAILSKSLSEGPPTNTDCARTLAEGLSQTTSNLIASTFQVHPRMLMQDSPAPQAVYSPTVQYSPAEPEYSPVPCTAQNFPIPVEYPQAHPAPQPEYYQQYYYQPM